MAFSTQGHGIRKDFVLPDGDPMEMDSVALLLVNNLRSAREKKRNEQAADAKEKGWSFDPRAKIVVEPTLYDLCVEGLSCLDEVVDYYIKKYTFATADDAPNEATAAQTYCSNATAEVSGMENFSDEEIMAFGFTRLLQLVPATYICDLVDCRGFRHGEAAEQGGHRGFSERLCGHGEASCGPSAHSILQGCHSH